MTNADPGTSRGDGAELDEERLPGDSAEEEVGARSSSPTSSLKPERVQRSAGDPAAPGDESSVEPVPGSD